MAKNRLPDLAPLFNRLTYVYTNQYTITVIPQSFESFDWDDWNREKCQKHGVSINEIEEALKAEAMMILPDLKHSDEEDRFIATGQSNNGRYLFVAFTLREMDGKNIVRPISSRYMHKMEAEKYEQASAKIKDG